MRVLRIIRGKLSIGRLILKTGYKGGIIIRAIIRSVSKCSALDFLHVHNHGYSYEICISTIVIISTLFVYWDTHLRAVEMSQVETSQVTLVLQVQILYNWLKGLLHFSAFIKQTCSTQQGA